MNTAKLDIRGIKCDNEECDFVDMDIKREDYDSWLNRPCPQCGSNLLTEKDYNLIKRLEKIASLINSIFPKNENATIESRISIELDGSGLIKDTKTTITDIED